MTVEYWYPSPIYYFDNNDPLPVYKEIKNIEPQLEKIFKPDVWNDNVESTFGTCRCIIKEFKLNNFYNFIKISCIYKYEFLIIKVSFVTTSIFVVKRFDFIRIEK